MEAALSIETVVADYKTVWWRNVEDQSEKSPQ
jgi:hypothetical protein